MKPSNATANRHLQRGEPILTRKWLPLDRSGSPFHGVVSWRLAGRLLVELQSEITPPSNSNHIRDATCARARGR